MRGFIARSLRAGWWPGGVFILDGKGGSDFIVFEGREGIHCVARHPEEWAEWLPRISSMLRQRYDEDAEYERGNTEQPDFPRYLVVLDEVQEIRATLGKAVLDPVLQQVSRQIRASRGKLLVATQRPDAEDAIPGAVKDMLEDRLILGYVSEHGARMVLGKDWREAVDEYGADTVPGRGLARVGGRLRRIQGFYLATPRRHPEVEHLYPPRHSTTDTPPETQTNAKGPATATRWAPSRAATASDHDAQAVPEDATVEKHKQNEKTPTPETRNKPPGTPETNLGRPGTSRKRRRTI
jgi:DNA segregation ATPase FtsK/SpoIIIE-like protein